jgi:hypothetical protein
MRPIVLRTGTCAVLAILAFRVGAGPIDRAIPRPLPSHPGNIFLAGEPVVVAEPPGEVETWRAVDYDGKLAGTGRFKDGKAELGPLPVGWYKIVRGKVGHWTNRVSLGVLEPLRVPTPVTSPIDIDVAMAWIFPDARMAQVINLCQLAGMNRVRDRLSWPEIEPQRGQFAAHTRYDDSVRAQTAAGLQVLDVNHISSPWANTNSMHFPPDLRDVYDSCRELARRWQGQIEAFEPWNEADIKEFGGHTGSEMATLQKAAWLGLKAGNPGLTVCQNVFAIHRLATLHDFQDNEAWPYFDTFNLHHYDPFRDYPRLFQEFRSVSAGKPMWVTECNVIVPWQDEKTKEPSEADLRVQSERVTMIYSMDIYEGAQAVFYFMLPHYVEYMRQYGLLRPDLTPRPAFLAAAAAGRLLVDAKPLGRAQSNNQEIHGYLFSAKPDGRPTDVLVIWSDKDTTFALPKPPAACFDHLGRARPVSSNVLKIGRAPQYFELAAGTRPPFAAPPKPAKLLTGHPGPVVLQALLPEKDIVVNESAYTMPEGRSMTIPVFLYNFGAKTVRGKLKVKTPAHWGAQLADKVEIEPGGRKELRLLLTHPETAGMTNEGIRITGHFRDGGGAPVLAFRLTSSRK